MRVKSIRVTELFGVFDHEIPLQNRDRVTIIHGPNGLGKTVMLRMIAAVIAGDTSIFEETPFSEFSLTLEDGSSRVIRRHVSPEEKQGKSRVRLELLKKHVSGHIETITPIFEGGDVPQSVLHQADKEVPGPYYLQAGGWRFGGEGPLISLAEIIRIFPRAASLVPKKYRPSLLFKDLDVFFVETNRLGEQTVSRSPELHGLRYVEPRGYISTDETTVSLPRVRHYSRDIQGRIQKVLAAYAKRSQENDRTYPERLVQFVRNREHPIAESEILDKMGELEKKRQRLISFGLLDSETGLRDLNENDVKGAAEALTIYVGDVQEKLQVFDDLAERIGSLMDIVNDRFKYKRLTVDRDRGFSVLSDLNQKIELENLSSGEQHELVLLYELLFRAPKNGLVLIDEPEISLHVAWQSRFLSDLIGILAVTDAYAIVATHSPVIIGNRKDLTIELQGPQK